MKRRATTTVMAAIRRLRHVLPLAESLRGGVACVVPAILAVQLHEPLLCWAAIASFWACLVDDSGATRMQRLLRGLLFALSGGAASGIAIAMHDVGLLPVLATGAAVYVGAMLRSRGALAGQRGVLAATAFAVSAVFPVEGVRAAAQYAAYFFVGGVWATVCCVGLWQFDPAERVRKATAAYMFGLADFLLRIAVGVDGCASRRGMGRSQLRGRLETMSATLRQMCGDLTDEAGDAALMRVDAERLIGLASGLEVLVAHGGDAGLRQWAGGSLSPVLKNLVSHIEETAGRIAAGNADGNLRDSMPNRQQLAHLHDNAENDSVNVFVTLVEEIEQGIHSIADRNPIRYQRVPKPASNIRPPTRNGLLGRFVELCGGVDMGDIVDRHAARMAVAAILAIALATLMGLRQGYWLVLTTILVMQPYVGRTLQISYQRLAGTVLGALVASVLGLLTQNHLLLACLVLPLAMGTLMSRAVSYLAFTLFLTPHFILVADVGVVSGDPSWLALLRVANSIGGVLLGVVASLLLWPDWEHRSLADTVQTAVLSCAACLQALAHSPAEPGRNQSERNLASARRREACLAIDSLEQLLQRMRLEFKPRHQADLLVWVCLSELRNITGIVAVFESVDHVLTGINRQKIAALSQLLLLASTGAASRIPERPPRAEPHDGVYCAGRYLESRLRQSVYFAANSAGKLAKWEVAR